MNSNMFHNIVNIVTMILAAATAGLIATGCVETPTGALDCAASWISPKFTGIAIMVLQGAKIAVNVVRDGIANLFKPQPPVES